MAETRSTAGLSVSWSRVLLLMMILWHATFGMGSQALIDVADVISAEDIQVGGSCVNGCVRRLSNAVAPVAGEAECDLVVQNLFDHKRSDLHRGTLNVIHSCTDANGDLRYQGSGQCLYEVCARATWEGDLMTYSVVVKHEATTEPHSVRVQVYLNLDEDVGALTSTGSGNSFSCTIGKWCPAPSSCPSETTPVQVVLKDSAGDGWVGALPGRANVWTVSKGGEMISSGTLAEGHFSNRTQLCLEEGLYTFSSTAYTAWSNETTWTVCDKEGAGGGRVDFQIASGQCIVVDTTRADGPPETSAQTNPDDYCELPRDTECVAYVVGAEESSGPSVGMYYDEACLEGGGGVAGCGGGGVVGCRVCFVNRENWETDFPDAKYPDWGDCPCCVADSLGVECQGGFTGPEPGPPTVLDVVSDIYVRATWPAIVAVGAVFLCCVCMALFCAQSLKRDLKLVASLRKGDSAGIQRYGRYKRKTSSRTSLEGGGMKSALSPSLGNGNQRAGVVPSPRTPVATAAPLKYQLPSTEARALDGTVEDEKEAEEQVDGRQLAGEEDKAGRQVKDVSPAVPAHRAPAKNLTAPQGSLAGMHGNHHGMHGSQVSKMQWGAGRDARALMGMGTYNKMLSDENFETFSPRGQDEGQEPISRKSASRIGHAVRSVGAGVGKSESKMGGGGGVDGKTSQGSVARNGRTEGTHHMYDLDGDDNNDHPSSLEATVPLSTSAKSSSWKPSRQPEKLHDRQVPQEVPTRSPTRVSSGSPVRRPALSYKTPRDKARKDKVGAPGALGRAKSTKEVDGVQDSGAKGGAVSDSYEPKNPPVGAASQEVKQVPSKSPGNRAALTYKTPREKTKSGKISGQVRDAAAAYSATVEDDDKLQDRSRGVRGLGGSSDLAKDVSRAPMAGSRGLDQVLPDHSARRPQPSHEAYRDKPRISSTPGWGTNDGRQQQQDRAARGVGNGGDHLKQASNAAGERSQVSNQASFDSPPYRAQLSYDTRREKGKRGSKTTGRAQSAGVAKEGDVSPQSRGRSVGAKPRGQDAAAAAATTPGEKRSSSVPKSFATASSPSRARAVHPSQSPNAHTTSIRRSPSDRSPLGTKSSAVSGRSVRKRPGSSAITDDGDLQHKGNRGTGGTRIAASNGNGLRRGSNSEPVAEEDHMSKSPEGRTRPQRKTARYSPGYAAVAVSSKGPGMKTEGVGSLGMGTRGGFDARVK